MRTYGVFESSVVIYFKLTNAENMEIKLIMLNNRNFAESMVVILTVWVVSNDSRNIKINITHWIIIKRAEIAENVLYASGGSFVMVVKYILDNKTELINEDSNKIKGANEVTIPDIIVKNGISVLRFASDKIIIDNIVIAVMMQTNPTILPLVEFVSNA